MSLITESLLVRCGAAPSGAALYAPPLAASCDKRGVTTRAAVEVLLANVLNESGALTRASEDLTYLSASHIAQTFPTALRGWTKAQIAGLVNNPVALGNAAYRALGGYDFRGRGLGQVTGHDNYAAYAADVGRPLGTIGAYMETPEGAADSAVWFFVRAGCGPLAAAGDLLEARRRWAGCRAPAMPEGWTTVQVWYGQVTRAFGSEPAAAIHAGGAPAVEPPTPAPPVAQRDEADVLDDEYNPTGDAR